MYFTSPSFDATFLVFSLMSGCAVIWKNWMTLRWKA